MVMFHQTGNKDHNSLVDHKNLQLMSLVTFHGKGKLKTSNIVHGSFQTSFKNFHVDGDSNDLKKNVDKESKVPSGVTLKI